MESHNIYLSILLSNAGFRPKREGRARPDGTPAADFQNLKKRRGTIQGEIGASREQHHAGARRIPHHFGWILPI